MAAPTSPGNSRWTRSHHATSTPSTACRASRRKLSRLAVDVPATERSVGCLHDPLYLELGFLQKPPGYFQMLDALLEQLERPVEIQVVRFEPAHDRFQPRELVPEHRLVRHFRPHPRAGGSATRTLTSPSVTVSRKPKP